MQSKLKVPCQIFSRIVGYYRPVSSWNKAKRREFLDRRDYKQPILKTRETSAVALDN